MRARFAAWPGEGGFSLVELMVAMLLSSIVASGMLAMFSTQRQTLEAVAASVETQSSAGGAIDYLAGQVQKAGFGFGGCPGGEIQMWDGAAGVKPSSYSALRVYNGCNLLTTAPGACASSSLASDSFSVSYAASVSGSTVGVRLTRALPATSAALVVNSTAGFSAGHLVALWQPGSTNWCTMLKLSDVSVMTVGTKPELTLAHAQDGIYNPPAGTNIFPPGGYPEGALVLNLTASGLRPRHFAIDHVAKPPRLVTWTSSSANPSQDTADLEPVADGVEDLQIAWACDVNGNGRFDEGADLAGKRSDEWSGNVSADNRPVCGTRPIQIVRLTVITRSASPQLGQRNGFRPGAEDRAAGTAAIDLRDSDDLGTYRRRVLSVVVSPQNLSGAAL